MSVVEDSKDYSKPVTKSTGSVVAPEGGEFPLKSISTSAVLGLVTAILCLISLWICWVIFDNWTFSIFFALIPIALGSLAWIKIRRHPDEYWGLRLAQTSLFLGVFCLVAGFAIQSYVYHTEVPEGYERITWKSLKLPDRDLRPYNPAAEELDGKKVFFKAYVRPDNKSKGLKKFIVVPDFGTCCFGKSPKMSDCVAVEIKTDDTVDVDFTIRKFAGVFKLHKNSVATRKDSVPRIVYELHAEYVK